MKKSALVTFLALVLLFPLSSTAQFCGFDDDLDSFKINYQKEYYQVRASHVAALKHFTRYNPGVNYLPRPVYCENCLQGGGQCPQANYMLPVVVHIIHLPSDTLGQGSNITDAQVEHQLEILNKIYRNDAGLNSINTGIQFCLAQKRPDGTSFNGINHIASDSSNLHRYKQSELTSLIHYPTDHYINIYVVNMMFDNNDDTLNVAGFASYPYRGSRANDLIVIRADWFGDYTVFNHLYSQSRGKTIVHEMGHYLGLYHPFQDGCSGSDSSDCTQKGDLCCDVPQVAIQKLGYCGPDNTCPETPNDSADQKENHMDYGLETCRTRFTADQANLMYTTLNGVRSGLWLPSNINNLELACCVNAVAFDGFTDVCQNTGDSIHLTAYDIDSATYTWYLFKNDIAYDTLTSGYNHQITFLPDTGLYDIELVVSKNGTNYNRQINQAIEVLMCDSLLPSTQGSWYFGQYAGIRFYKNGLVLRDIEPFDKKFPTQINSDEGTISMCDSMGNLLFYGGGEDGNYNRENNFIVFDKNYKEVVNSPIYGDGSSSQAGVTFRKPNSNSKYYIFTLLSASNSVRGLYYSLFDLSKTSNGTIGEIDTPFNIQILDTLGDPFIPDELILAIPGCIENLYWILFTENSASKLNILKVDGSGIHYIKSYALGNSGEIVGKIKSSPDGNFISIENANYRFNKSNGDIQHLQTDSALLNSNLYGLSYSPNSQYLYRLEQENLYEGVWIKTSPTDSFITWKLIEYHNYLYQLDMFSSNKNLSKRKVGEVPYYWETLQLAPDNKIYISQFNNSQLAVINLPNNRVLTDNDNLCEYSENSITLNRNGTYFITLHGAEGKWVKKLMILKN